MNTCTRREEGHSQTIALILFVAASLPSCVSTSTSEVKRSSNPTTVVPPAKPHVLFVVADDLRPTLGVYGTQALTPNIDALAKRGVTFTRAYTQFPWCAPTRQSFMTGRRPDTTRAWTFLWSFRDTIPGAVPLPQHFRRQGWHTVSVGKLYHGRNCVRGDPGCCAANASFSSCIQLPADGDWAGGNGSWDEPPVDFAKVGCEHGANWCARSGVNESEWCDYKIAQASVARVRAHAAQSRLGEPTQPLFLGVGFRDPHLPWASPPRWHDLFDPNKVNATSRGATPRFVSSFNTAENGGVPKVAWQWPAWVGPSTRGGINISDTEWLSPPALSEALGSYMASIAFTDAQLGKIFGALDDVNYTQSTLVLFTGDHGQNVGEHNTWCKMTAWEHSLRVPLIVAAPWLVMSHGQYHSGMAEMCDFYRTLSDLAGIDPATVDKGVEGDSLADVVANPSAQGKPYAFSQTNRVGVASLKAELPPRGLPNLFSGLPVAANEFYDPSGFSADSDLEWMGYTVRSATWRFTEWLQWDGTRLCPIPPMPINSPRPGDEFALVELYNHTLDTTPFDLDIAEYNNVAALHSDIVEQQRAVLRTKVRYCPPSPPRPPPSPPPPPTPLACPDEFNRHTPGGYWANTWPCPPTNATGCTKDRVNITATACGSKCLRVDGCVAFEVYDIDVPEPAERACYLFLHNLALPFVQNAHAFTCVRK